MEPDKINRRKFITGSAAVVGSAALLASPALATAGALFANEQDITVGAIMDAFIEQVPGAPFPNTVDTLKSGSRDMNVTGVVTTMFATIEVIGKAIAAGANFIIAHEPTFYNHADDVSWLQNDGVYRYKADLLKQHNIAVWRNHDYIHSLKEDGVFKQVIDVLGWEKFGNGDLRVFNPEPVYTLSALINHCKQRLNISMVRYIGDLNRRYRKVLLMPGAAGGRRQIDMIMKLKPDVVVCGEISEWETAEYVRDARAEGRELALIVLGHIASEEPGSVYMANWLRENFKSVKVTHIPPGNSLSFA